LEVNPAVLAATTTVGLNEGSGVCAESGFQLLAVLIGTEAVEVMQIAV
jgi:hypothetical protein